MSVHLRPPVLGMRGRELLGRPAVDRDQTRADERHRAQIRRAPALESGAHGRPLVGLDVGEERRRCIGRKLSAKARAKVSLDEHHRQHDDHAETERDDRAERIGARSGDGREAVPRPDASEASRRAPHSAREQPRRERQRTDDGAEAARESGGVKCRA